MPQRACRKNLPRVLSRTGQNRCRNCRTSRRRLRRLASLPSIAASPPFGSGCACNTTIRVEVILFQPLGSSGRLKRVVTSAQVVDESHLIGGVFGSANRLPLEWQARFEWKAEQRSVLRALFWVFATFGTVLL